ncbi:hypothetical protein BDZ85DRAFT_255713 [Elsinoe ampelina]|uniref:Uncharacterized protein n=1 Tax=Elsinoe ampelina TaxID=302913 RepID=A0A6A6GRF6_9PEZI|nr:hypothetical protein BDZ85DRAFT_255713 [Elsinoe ampelina]
MAPSRSSSRSTASRKNTDAALSTSSRSSTISSNAGRAIVKRTTQTKASSRKSQAVQAIMSALKAVEGLGDDDQDEVSDSEAEMTGPNIMHRDWTIKPSTAAQTNGVIMELQQRLQDMGTNLQLAQEECTASKEKIDQLRYDNHVLRGDLHSLTASNDYPREEELTAKMHSLYHRIDDWARGLFSPTTKGVMMTKNHSFLWVRRWQPSLPADEDKEYRRFALISMIGIAFVNYQISHAAFGRVHHDKCAAIAAHFKDTPKVGPYKKMILALDTIRRDEDPNYRQAIIDSGVTKLKNSFVKVLDSMTTLNSAQLQMQVKALKRIAVSAIEISEMLYLNPVTYRLLPFLYEINEYDGCEEYDDNLHEDVGPIGRAIQKADPVNMLVFPGLMRDYDERGQKVPYHIDNVLCKVKVLTSAVEKV